MPNTKRIKSIIFGAILLVVLLLLCCVLEIVGINQKRSKLENQNKQIAKLDTQLTYYENQQINNPQKDNKNPDGEIIIED